MNLFGDEAKRGLESRLGAMDERVRRLDDAMAGLPTDLQDRLAGQDMKLESLRLELASLKALVQTEVDSLHKAVTALVERELTLRARPPAGQ